MKPVAAFLAGLALTPLGACQLAEDAGSVPTGPAAQAPAAAAASHAPANLIASAESLVGEYRIASVGGADINLPHGITAEITTERIAVTSDCIRLAWDYRFEDGALATERGPISGCRRALLPEEEGIAAAFDKAGMVRRTPTNGIEFAGGGHSVLLFSQ